jgi:hypothetical protein
MLHDSPKIKTCLTHLLGSVMLALAFGITLAANTSATAAAPAAAEAQQAGAETQDPCESECPGETPQGDCQDNCQHCSCCSATAASSLMPTRVDTRPVAASSGDVLTATSSTAPTGVTHGVFKPPRQISA